VPRWGVGHGTAGAANCCQCLDDSAPRETGSGFDALAFDGAVDRRAADAEELGNFEGAVLPAVHQRDQVRHLATAELGPFATQPALGLGDLHALAGTKSDQV
jgi:hypothetical protein